MILKNLNFQNNGVLLIFVIFSCSVNSKNELRRNGWRLTDVANRNCYRLLRVSWTLAQISCNDFCSTTCLVYLMNFQTFVTKASWTNEKVRLITFGVKRSRWKRDQVLNFKFPFVIMMWWCVVFTIDSFIMHSVAIVIKK